MYYLYISVYQHFSSGSCEFQNSTAITPHVLLACQRTLRHLLHPWAVQELHSEEAHAYRVNDRRLMYQCIIVSTGCIRYVIYIELYIYMCIYIYKMSLVSQLLLPCVNQLLYGKCKRSTASSLRFPGSKREPSGSQGIAQIWERCISWEKAKSWATRRCRWQCYNVCWCDMTSPW
jgi:hypothetical protein